jgi:hypothetical protein
VLNISPTGDNTVRDNQSHETYWASCYPVMDYGHNNFSTEDDTIIYISGTPLTTLWARGNYWGGGAPDTLAGGPKSFYGPGITFKYSPWDTQEQLNVAGGDDPGEADINKGGAGLIADADQDAQELLRATLDIESEHPLRAMDNYRRLIRENSESAAAPVAVERLLWLVRNQYQDREQMDRLDGLSRYFRDLADTSRARTLVWKARRAALWALAFQHRYDEAIRGFEAIIQNHNCLADSVFAVIDAGTLHLEARA